MIIIHYVIFYLFFIFLNYKSLDKLMQNRHNYLPKNARFTQSQIQQSPSISFSSGMTSEQKFNSIV